MKKLFFLAIAALLAVSLNAQEVQETTVAIGNLNAPAFTLSLQKDKKVVQSALEERFKEAKLKIKKSEGFDASLGAIFPEIAPSPINLYTKVDGNSKSCVVTVCAMSTDLSANQQTINSNVVNFLNNFNQYLIKREAAAQLKVAQNTLKKAEKEKKDADSDLAKLEKTASSYQKKADKIESNIRKWEDNIADAQKDLKQVNADLDKATNGKLPEAKKRVQDADQAVIDAKALVQKWQQLAQ